MHAVDVIVTAVGHQVLRVDTTMAHAVLVVAVAVLGPLLHLPLQAEVGQLIVQTQRLTSRPITEVHNGRIMAGLFTAVLGRAPKHLTILLVDSWSSTWTWAVHTAV